MLARLLPALMPSWRFFDAIGPSPRLDYAWVHDDTSPTIWHTFRPQPARVGVARMVARLLWNPMQNESLYIVRCAERIVEGETDFPVRELRWRLLLAERRGELVAQTAPSLRRTPQNIPPSSVQSPIPGHCTTRVSAQYSSTHHAGYTRRGAASRTARALQAIRRRGTPICLRG